MPRAKTVEVYPKAFYALVEIANRERGVTIEEINPTKAASLRAQLYGFGSALRKEKNRLEEKRISKSAGDVIEADIHESIYYSNLFDELAIRVEGSRVVIEVRNESRVVKLLEEQLGIGRKMEERGTTPEVSDEMMERFMKAQREAEENAGEGRFVDMKKSDN